jgi:SmpA/OmlA family protein
MRKWKLLAVLAVLAVGAFVLWPRPNPITQENCDRIREGMSRAEVVAILGPPGDYRTGQTADPVPLYYRSDRPTPAEYAKAAYDRENVFVSRNGDGWERLIWLGDEGDIFVWFRRDGVSSHGLVYSNKVTQTPLQNFLWRAKRLWHRWFP